MIKITDKSKCCGCNACKEICPKKCIEMKSDSEGFLYPVVNKEKCTNCKLCERVCPIKNAKEKSDDLVNCYVAYVDDDKTRLKSSSGGLFSEIAQEILKRNGVIFGAAFDDEFNVNHTCIQDKKDLYKLMGSKYTQSIIGDTYAKVKEILNSNRYVLYSGTACQIEGLKSYLRKDYEKLYTIDVLCHGVPSPRVWKLYLDYQKETYVSDIEEISFRLKEPGWKNYSIKMLFKNSKKFQQRAFKNDYMNLFLSNICLRPSCHDCKFKRLNRSSDITIGDAWGVQSFLPEMDDDKGTSVVLIHSEKGKELFEIIKNHLKYKQCKVDQALPPTADSRKSVKIHKKRNKFFCKLNKGTSIETLAKMIRPTISKRLKGKAKRIARKILK